MQFSFFDCVFDGSGEISDRLYCKDKESTCFSLEILREKKRVSLEIYTYFVLMNIIGFD